MTMTCLCDAMIVRMLKYKPTSTRIMVRCMGDWTDAGWTIKLGSCDCDLSFFAAVGPGP